MLVAQTYSLRRYTYSQILSLSSILTSLQELCLGIQGQDCSTVIVIQSGDLCTSIAQNAGIPLSTLLSNNPNVNSDCSNIYPGEVSTAPCGAVLPNHSTCFEKAHVFSTGPLHLQHRLSIQLVNGASHDLVSCAFVSFASLVHGVVSHISESSLEVLNAMR